MVHTYTGYKNSRPLRYTQRESYAKRMNGLFPTIWVKEEPSHGGRGGAASVPELLSHEELNVSPDTTT